MSVARSPAGAPAGTQALDKLFAAMQGTKGIPALESNVSSVLNSLGDDNKNHQDIAAQITEDFALTQRVLKLANSSMYAPFAQDAASVTTALAVLGKDALMHVVLGTAMATASEVKSDERLSKTLLASELARGVCADRAEDVSVAALMYDLGGLMVTKFLPKEADAINTKIAAGAAPALAATDILGMPLQQFGAAVAKRWHLPAALVSIIDGTGDPTLVGVAKFSNTASSLMLEGRAEELAQLTSALNLPGIDKAKATAFISQKLEEIIPTASTPAADAPASVLGPLLGELAQTKWKTVEALADAMFAKIEQVLRPSHCLLLMLTPFGAFDVRAAYGKGADKFKSKLRLTKEYQPTVFHAAVRSKTEIFIADVSKLKPSALPEGYSTLLPDARKFILLPLGARRVSGLFYCDWNSDEPIDPAELAALKRARNLLGPFLPD